MIQPKIVHSNHPSTPKYLYIHTDELSIGKDKL
jgi:hypothetical protein